VIGAVAKGDDLISENNFHVAFDPCKQQLRKIASADRYEPSAGQFAKNTCSKTARALAAIVYDSQFAHMVADAVDVAFEPADSDEAARV